MKQEATVELAGGKILIETGNLAKQAHGSAVVRMGDNVVLATAWLTPTRAKASISSPSPSTIVNTLTPADEFPADSLNAKDVRANAKY